MKRNSYLLILWMMLLPALFSANAYALGKKTHPEEKELTKAPAETTTLPAEEEAEEADELFPGVGDPDCSQWGPDSAETVKQISLYREYFKQDNYKEAIRYWRYVFTNAPGARQQTHIDGVIMFKDMYEKTDDAELQAAYMDTVMMIYDKRMSCFGETADIYARKGLDIYKLDQKNVEEQFKAFEKSAELAKWKLPYYAINLYFYAAAIKWQKKTLTPEEVIDLYFYLSEVIEKNKKGKLGDKYEGAQGQLDDLMLQLKLLKCEEVAPKAEKKIAENPNDLEMMAGLFKQLRAAKCACEPVLLEIAEKLNEAEPDLDKAQLLAKCASNNQEFDKSLKYYKQALDMTEDSEEQAEYSLAIAKIYQSKNDYPTARSYAQKAAGLKSGWGDPYLLIGDLYRGSGKLCGPGTGFKSQVVTWAAVDMYEKAKAVDPSVAGKANSKIADTKKYFPITSECFFHGLKEGDSFEIDCWIQTSTTVRCKAE